MLFRLRCYDMHIHVYAEPPMGGYRFSETIDAHGRPGAHFYAGILPLIWTQCKSLFVKNYHFFWNFLYPTPRHDKRALLLAARPLFFRELRCHYRSCAVNTISPG